MGYGMIEHDAFESMMAVLEIVDAADVEGKFDDTPRQVEAEHEVVSYIEDDEGDDFIGHQFRDWYAFKRNKKTGKVGIGPNTKLHNLIRATLPEGYLEKKEFDPADLVGKRFRAQVYVPEGSKYSRIKWDNIGALPPKRRPKATPAAPIEYDDDKDLEGTGIEALDVPEDAGEEDAA
jgi:hypothetical protein